MLQKNVKNPPLYDIDRINEDGGFMTGMVSICVRLKSEGFAFVRARCGGGAAREGRGGGGGAVRRVGRAAHQSGRGRCRAWTHWRRAA